MENEFNGDFGQIHKFEKFNDTIFYMIYEDENNNQNNVNIGVSVLSVKKNKLEIKKNQKLLIQENDVKFNASKVTEKSIVIDYYNSNYEKLNLYYLDISTLNSLFIGKIPGKYNFDLFSNNLIFVSNFISKFPRPTCHDYKINLVCDSSVSIGINKLTNDAMFDDYFLKLFLDENKRDNLKCFNYQNNIQDCFNENNNINLIRYESNNCEITNKIIINYFLYKKKENNPAIIKIPSDLCTIEINFICYESCQTCYGKGNFEFQNCESCKEGFYLNNRNCEDINKIKLNLNQNNHEFITNIKEDEILQNYNLLNDIQILNVDYIIIKSNEISFIKYNINFKELINETTINLGNCEKTLREKNNLTEDEPIFITQISYINNPIETVNYKIYNQDNIELSLDCCKNDKIIIKKKISSKTSKILNLDDYYKLKSKGYNIYDPKSKIYSNECIRYSINKKDLTLKDKRDYLFKDISFCDNNCIFKEINNNYIICECKDEYLTEKSNNNNNCNENINKCNIKLFKCYNILFKDLKHSIGFYIILFGIIIQIILLILLFTINKESESNNSKKIRYLTNINENTIFFSKNNIQFYNKQINDNQKIINNEMTTTNYNNKNKLIISSNKTNKPFFQKKIDESESSTKRQLKSLHQNPLKKMYEDKKFLKEEEISSEELNESNYKNSLLNDKRNFISCFKNYFFEKQFILSCIFSKLILFSLNIRIICLIFNIHTLLFLNALLYNDNYISKRFNLEGNGNLKYFFKNEIDKVIYSTLLGIIIGKISLLFTNSGYNIRKLLKEKKEIKDNKSINDNLNDELKYAFIKRIIGFIFIFILEILYFYYICIFCYIYQYTQILWLISTLMSILFNIVFSCLISLIISLLRIISLKKQIWLIFAISKIINDIC